MKIKDWMLILLILTTTSACKMDMKTEIYIRDIEDVSLKNAEGLHTSGLLKVGVPNCKNKEKLSEVTGLLKDYFLNVSEKTCEAGMESLLTIGVDIPIINSYIISIVKEIDLNKKSLFKIPRENDYKEEIIFGEKLISQVFENKNKLKSYLDGRIPNWDTERIAQIDLAILISAIAELIYFPLIPVKVTINEYIEISKEYSSPKSSVFINGVLDKIIKDLTDDGTILKTGRGLIT